MQSQIKTYRYPNGEIQRVQIVRWEDWSKLDFLEMSWTDGALTCSSNIYRNFLVPAAPWLFGNMVMFHIPEDLEVPFSRRTGKYGHAADPLTAAAAALKEGVRFAKGKPIFQNDEIAAFWHALEARNSIRIVSGKLPTTTVIPLGNLPGYITDTAPDARLKVNASFFIMDRFDCATVYDHVGTPIGLRVKDGKVFAPPLYYREALLVKNDGTVSVQPMDVTRLRVQINGRV